jgi:hypothetical protein
MNVRTPDGSAGHSPLVGTGRKVVRDTLKAYGPRLAPLLYAVPIAAAWSGRWLKSKWDVLYFACRHARAPQGVKIVLAHFDGYPLYREKQIFNGVIKCGIGRLFDNMVRYRAGVPLEVILVVNLGRDAEYGERTEFYRSLQLKYSFITKIVLRDNSGCDCGGYNAGFLYLKECGYRGDVVFMNSSARGPSNHYWLLKYQHMFSRRDDIGLCGISMNSHTTHLPLDRWTFRPHVQGFFLYTNMEIAMLVYGDALPGALTAEGLKREAISDGELMFSQMMLDRGYGICSKLFESFVYYKGRPWSIPQGDTRFTMRYYQFANKL